MPASINAAILALGMLAGILSSRRALKSDPDLSLTAFPRKAAYLYVPVAIMFVLISKHVLLAFVPWLYWYMPLWLELHYSEFTWGTVLAVFSFIFTFVVVIAFATHHRNRWTTLAAALLLIVAVEVSAWMQTREEQALESSPNPAISEHGVVLQTNTATCVPAAVASILRITYDYPATERAMIDLLGTTAKGTSPAQVIYGLRRIGFRAGRVTVSDTDPENLHAPALLFVDHPLGGYESHSMAYMGD